MSTRAPGCGRSADYLRELVADEAWDGPARSAGNADLADLAHLAACPDCAAEAAELRRQWARVHAVARATVEVPPALVPRTLATLRAIRGDQATDHVDIDQSGGTLRLRHRVVVVLTRELARDLLEELRRRWELAPGSCRVLAVVGAPTELTVQVALPYGVAVRELAEHLRIRLTGALLAQLDAAAPAVWVEVADIEVAKVTRP